MSNPDQDLEARWEKLGARLSKKDQGTAPPALVHLARFVAGVTDPDMTCEECEAKLPTYIDEERGGMPVGQLYPRVKRHLDLCESCQQLYLSLMEQFALHEAGELPVPERLQTKKPDLSFLPSRPSERVPTPTPTQQPRQLSPIPFIPYVRQLSEQLIASVWPTLRQEYDDFIQAFVSVMESQQASRQSALALGQTLGGNLSGQDEFDAFGVLTAVAVATASLGEGLSPAEVQSQARSGQLAHMIQLQATQALTGLPFSPDQVVFFAQAYADLISRNPDQLQAFLAGQTK